MLSYLLNNIKDSSYYNSQCQVFLNNSNYIDFKNLLNKYNILFEYQPIILLLYEILVQVNLIDFNIVNIDGYFLLEEIHTNNHFYDLNYDDLINNLGLESLKL